MKAFIVFKVFGEGDGYSVFDFMSIHSTIELAQEEINNDEQGFEHNDLCHKSMSEENNFTFIGKREDCSDQTRWNRFAGYIIEEVEIK